MKDHSQGIFAPADNAHLVKEDFGEKGESAFEKFNTEALKFFQIVVKLENHMGMMERNLVSTKLSTTTAFKEFIQ